MNILILNDNMNYSVRENKIIEHCMGSISKPKKMKLWFTMCEFMHVNMCVCIYVCRAIQTFQYL